MTCHRSPVFLAAYMTCLGGFMGIGSFVGLNPAIAHSSVNLSQPLVLAQSPSPKGIEELPLQVGSRGETVQALQTRLKKLGYYEGDTDGVYGDTTRLAVIEFQESIDLNADGVVGLTTWTKLQAAAAEVPEPDNSPAEVENAEEDNQNAEKAQSNSQRKQLLWILAGLSGTLVVFGGGLFFLIKVLDSPKKEQASAKAEDSLPSSPPEEPEPPMVMSSSNGLESSPVASVDTPSPASEADKNGYNPSGLSVTNSHLTESSSPVEPSPRTSLTKPKNRLAKKNGVNQLIKDLQDSDPAKRRKAIWELAQRGDSRAVQPLVNLMLESDSQQRSLIVEALSQIGMKTLKPMNRALALSLQDDNPQVRKNAIRDVTLMYELVAQISQLLSYALDDPEADVQETARWALSQLERIRTPATVNSLPPSHSPLSFSENQLKEPPMFD
ncbi:peptidoglycan-binding protein [Coleofasciculus sp. E1-EBD-02]|uniref:peptidoglycan-binding protein n=1 Tax=Coleofasciculus sp. E1-EBD-02 TaxID=3068481 RepID=UPI003301D633